MHRLKRLLVGTPLPTAQARHERLGKATALAVFASDALSSVAYATEEIVLVLMLAGVVALSYSLPIGIAISLLIVIVVSSYRQTILAYPKGGGAYIVTKDNLGTVAGLIAAAALLIDYVLTVAVSVAAGIAAVTSALPVLFPYRVWLGVLGVVAIAVANLRGIRESGKIFALPTYLFVGSMLLVIGYGGVGAVFGWIGAAPYAPHPAGLEGVGLFLLLRAFAAGCSALTGVEAVSDGVPAFKPPEAHNARVVLAWLGALLVTLFLGITFLAYDFGIRPPTSRGCRSSWPATASSRGSSATRGTGSSSPMASSSWAGWPRCCWSSFAATRTPSSRSTRSASSSRSRCRSRAWSATGCAAARKAGGGAPASTASAPSSPGSSCSRSRSRSSRTAPGSSCC